MMELYPINFSWNYLKQMPTKPNRHLKLMQRYNFLNRIFRFSIFFFSLNMYTFTETFNYEFQTCSSCSDDAPATSWCVECAEYICDSCVQAHQRLKITKDHTIKSKEEAIADNQSSTNDEKMLMCHIHPQVNTIRFIHCSLKIVS